MSFLFEEEFENWLNRHIEREKNARRRERLRNGLSHGTIVFLRTIWFPIVGNLEDLHPEYEVRDFNGGYRYLDLAYMRGGAKGCIEIQDYRSHARDIEAGRFKDLCMKQALLVLDDWFFLPIAYLSIRDDPEICKQLVLSFIGKFLSMDTAHALNWAEAETLRFSRRLLRPFTAEELARNLQLTVRHTRTVLHSLVNRKFLVVSSGKQRYRSYRLP